MTSPRPPDPNRPSSVLRLPIDRANFRLTQEFKGSAHRGIDMAAPIGTPIGASYDGSVVAAGPASGFGLWVVIDHNIGGQKYSTVYGHNNENKVRVGQTVRTGQLIATVGNRGQSTGPHLHFEVWRGGRLTGGTAIDPITATAGSVGVPPAQDIPEGQPGNPETNLDLPDWIENSFIGETLQWIHDAIKFVEDPTTWVRAGLFLAGALFLLFGFWSIVGKRTVIDLSKIKGALK